MAKTKKRLAQRAAGLIGTLLSAGKSGVMLSSGATRRHGYTLHRDPGVIIERNIGVQVHKTGARVPIHRGVSHELARIMSNDATRPKDRWYSGKPIKEAEPRRHSGL